MTEPTSKLEILHYEASNDFFMRGGPIWQRILHFLLKYDWISDAISKRIANKVNRKYARYIHSKERFVYFSGGKLTEEGKEFYEKALKESNEKMYRTYVDTPWKKAMFWWIVRNSKNLPK